MTMIRDVQAHLAQLLEPAPAVAKKLLDKEPRVWDVEHLYVYPVRVDEVPFETASSRRQEFTLVAVYITDDQGEGAALVESEGLAEAMDTKRGTYMAAVRQNQATALWNMLRAISDTPNPIPFDKRSAAIRVSGWRVIAGGA